MQKNNLDRRVQKTCQLLKDALIALISEKAYKEVTIQEILDRANVGRSTFYLHYDNKDELLHSCFEEFNNRLNQYNAELLRTAHQETDNIFYINAFFHFVEKNHGFFKSLMGERGLEVVNKGIHDYVYGYIERMVKKIDERKKMSPIKTDMLTHYTTDALIGVLKWWVISNMPCTTVEISDYVLRQVKCNIEESLNM